MFVTRLKTKAMSSRQPRQQRGTYPYQPDAEFRRGYEQGYREGSFADGRHQGFQAGFCERRVQEGNSDKELMWYKYRNKDDHQEEEDHDDDDDDDEDDDDDDDSNDEDESSTDYSETESDNNEDDDNNDDDNKDNKENSNKNN